MQILLVTPAAIHSRSGNRTTATRWKKIFQLLGHNVTVVQQYQNESADIMVAIHAWRSADSIKRFSKTHPNQPLIVVLSGTDAYRFIHTHTDTTIKSIQSADRLVGLHANISQAIPEEYRSKIRVIYQSANFLPRKKTSSKYFKICVAGHLRDEKDPLRPAYAARSLPQHSKIEIHHYGKAHTKDWAKRARSEEARNIRYQWHGEVAQALLTNKMRQTKLLILPSIMEGGANIISESLAVGLPVIASKIDGTVGLLGENYPGYFETGNTQDLRKLLIKAETDLSFLKKLNNACNKRLCLFSHEREINSWKNLFTDVCR